jgi:hypothetical protein
MPWHMMLHHACEAVNQTAVLHGAQQDRQCWCTPHCARRAMSQAEECWEGAAETPHSYWLSCCQICAVCAAAARSLCCLPRHTSHSCQARLKVKENWSPMGIPAPTRLLLTSLHGVLPDSKLYVRVEAGHTEETNAGRLQTFGLCNIALKVF